jgi:Family of unknown function (DUF6502)
LISELKDLLTEIGLDVTGLSSRRIRRTPSLRKLGNKIHYASSIGEILSAWRRNPDYVDSDGVPLRLPLSGASPSFEALSRFACPAIGFRQLLDDLKKVRAIAVDRENRVRIVRNSLPVYEDELLAKRHTLACLVGFVKTLKHNLHSAPTNYDQLFHRIAWNGNFQSVDVQRLKLCLNHRGQNFLESIDNWMTRHSSPSTSSRRKRQTVPVSVGVYLTVDDPEIGDKIARAHD